MQMVMHRNNAVVVNIQNYVVNNWHKFYKGQVVVSDTKIKSWGSAVLGFDNSTANEFSPIAATFSLNDIPLDYPISTLFYLEYKSESTRNIDASPFSSSTSQIPVYGVTTTSSINANSNAVVQYQEKYPNPLVAEYFDGVRQTLYSSYGMQIKSLAVNQLATNSKQILGARFYQNGYNIQANSPSILLLPGYWTKRVDSGATNFELWYNSVDYTNYYRMDLVTDAEFSVEIGDLVIATTMLEKHPYTAVDIEDIDLIYSWSRARQLNGGTAGHGLSLWFSKVNKTYSVSRNISEFPGSRFIVYRYDPNGQVYVPPPPPPPPPPPSDSSSGSYSETYFESWSPPSEPSVYDGVTTGPGGSPL